MRLLRSSRVAALILIAFRCAAQTNMGEIRLRAADASGLPVRGASAELVSEANEYRQTLLTDAEGRVLAKRLPFGMYRLSVRRDGFSPHYELLEIRSALPHELRVVMNVAQVETAVVVREDETLVDPHPAGSVNRIGKEMIDDREATLPGRSLAGLVAMQPGWLFEANGVLHPRGSEYQTQYVVDGVPLTDNRSAAFGADPGSDDVQSMSVMTAGYPAEFGRKLGGVIEVVTERDQRQGFHGKAVASGGSFGTAAGYLEAQYGWGRNTFTLSGDAARTDRFLDPPVEQNDSNSGSTGDVTAHYERDFGDKDRLGVIFRREQSRFLVPNEMLQQVAGQRQDRDDRETAGTVSYTHVFSASLLADVRGMVRDLAAGLWSNALATPIAAQQGRGLRETYVKASASGHNGLHEWKAGVEADFGSIREAFRYRLTDPSQFDPATAPAFQFAGRAQDREQGVFAQDLIRWKQWTVSAGLRYDHYGLVVHEGAWSPRLGAAWFWPKANMVFRASYDRVFQTPAFENILLASSDAVNALSDQVLRLPVRPSRGNYYEGGFSKGFGGKFRLDANYYRRAFDHFADDDVLLNTGVSFPISFRSAVIHGVEAKLELPRWGPLSGFVSYSNMRGTGYLPVSGGLFLEIGQAIGSFPVSQDQRNTVTGRYRYEIGKRVWVALGGSYGSGLPVQFNGSGQDALDAYGRRIVDRVDFDRGRVRPSYWLDASTGVALHKSERASVSVQVDIRNLTDELNVINFAGLFSGTALAAPRSAQGRVRVTF